MSTRDSKATDWRITIGSVPVLSSQTLITLDLQPDIIDRTTRMKLPAKSSMFQVSEPVGMDGKAKFHDLGSDGVNSVLLDRRPPATSDEVCQAGNMLWMALDAYQL